MILREPIPARLVRLRPVALAAGALGLAAALAYAFLVDPAPFFQSYLFAYLFWLELSLGSLALTMLHNLVGGGWGVLVRRVSEAGAKTLWLMALLFIPILFGLPHLYAWARPEAVAADPALVHKSLYLNVPFFIGRLVVYFAIWIGLTAWLTRWSTNPAVFTDPLVRRRFQRVSAIGLILYVLAMTFASIDWLMSLQPRWVSTIFGMLIVTGQVLAGMAFAIAMLPLLAGQRPLAEVVSPRLYRDLGALLLSFVIFWAYIAFAQYLVIWAANIPREVVWYLDRARGGWLLLGLLVVAVQFVLPFIVLLPLRTKQNHRLLAALSVAILLMRLVDYFWQVAPVFRPQGLSFHWMDFVLPLAIGGLWLGVFTWHLDRTPLMLPVEEVSTGEAARGGEEIAP